MSNASLKQILLKIARLPSSDQRWILHRLSNQQRATLTHWPGLKLLQRAQHFRTLKIHYHDAPLNPPITLPACCQHLSTKAPLYVAIVIEQGLYPWTTLFLQQFDQDGLIKASLENHVPDIKPLVKQALFSEWEHSSAEHYGGHVAGAPLSTLRSFDAFLEEDEHGSNL